MKLLTRDDLKTGQYITFLNPIWAFINVVNPMEQTVTPTAIENSNVVGKIFYIEAVDLPFILVTDILSENGFTIDIRNLKKETDIREVDDKYRKTFKKLFGNPPPVGPTNGVFTLTNMNNMNNMNNG